jgi:hypothetical protein
MRQFAIQALVDERALWDVMSVLESYKAQGIMARPYGALAGPKDHVGLLPPPAKSKREVRSRQSRARVAVMAVIAKGVPIISTAVIREQAGEEFPKQTLSQLFHLMNKKEKLLRRIGVGKYEPTAKGRSQHANGSTAS